MTQSSPDATPKPTRLPMTTEVVPIASLRPDDANLRRHDARNMDQVRASLARFGQRQPLVVRGGVVLGGNARLEAMLAMGWSEAAVVRVDDLSDEDARALAIALNRAGEGATWDEAGLAAILSEMDADLRAAAGFDQEELDQVVRDLERELRREARESEPVEPPAEPTTRIGDLWILGGHRLLCGDSTSDADVARLMNGEIASLLATDPPYLVDYDGGNHPAEHHKKAGRHAPEKRDSEVGNKHWDAYIDPESSAEFFRRYLEVALAHCRQDVPIYQWHATRRQALVEQAWDALDLLVHQTVIWVKTRGVLTRSHMLWKHEPCFYGWREGKQPKRSRRPPPSTTTVWEIGQAGEQDGIHPTQKPRDVFRWPIEWHTRAGEVVLEPFSGSGTQLVAAEELGRRCFAMELSPAFVDAGLLRWERMSGQRATLEGDGRGYEDVRAERLEGVRDPE